MLSLVLPTYNEAANIGSLIDLIDGVLQSVPHEIIVIDDNSPDGTWKVAEGLTAKHPALRVIRRIGRKGLSSAVVEGFDAARGDMLAVMDADGQHDGLLLLKLLSALSAGADIAVGSRYVSGGSVGEWVTDRRIISSTGTIFAKWLCRTKVSDPLGGFFAIKTELYRSIRTSLRPTGFKILLEILANVPEGTTVVEVPLIFRMRLHGQSKLSMRVHAEFLGQVLRLGTKRFFRSSCSFCGLIFCIASIAIFVTVCVRLWNIHRLYTNPTVRHQAERALRAIAAHEGWLLSDITITRVGNNDLQILHTEHMRDSRASRHCTVTLPAAQLTCEN